MNVTLSKAVAAVKVGGAGGTTLQTNVSTNVDRRKLLIVNTAGTAKSYDFGQTGEIPIAANTTIILDNYVGPAEGSTTDVKFVELV